MGCGGSKQPRDDVRPAVPLEPVQPAPGTQGPTAGVRTRGGSKAPSRRESRVPSPRRSKAPSRSGSRAPSPRGSKAPSRSGSRAPSPKESRGPSRKGSRPPSQGGSRAQSRKGSPGPSTRTRQRSDRPRAPLSTLDELPAEDGTIRHDIGVLNTYIEHHVAKFYCPQSDSSGIPIRKRIAEVVIKDIIEGSMNVRTVADDLDRNLERYAKTPSDRNRHDHIVDLCELARGIEQMWRRHPSTWTFGSWGPGIRFPSVLRDGEEVVPPDVDV